MKSWVPIPLGSHFSLANIPFGIISTPTNPSQRAAVAIGDQVLDLATFSRGGGFSALQEFPTEHLSVFQQPSLNAFAALGQPTHRRVRQYLHDVLRADTPYPAVLQTNEPLRQSALLPLSQVHTHLPLAIGDYTDFYAGRNHAHNVGMFSRGPTKALNRNYDHLPVAYHGRASSVVVSGTPLHRPMGQVLSFIGAQMSVFRPSAQVDMELELGAFLCRGNVLGEAVPVHEAADYVFGYVLLNDWSARDIQHWEHVPLGPFSAKNFGTTVSAWVVLADALEPFRATGLAHAAELLPYLRESQKDNVHDIQLEVTIQTAKGTTQTVARTSSKNLLWSWPQMIAHHTVGGCNLRVGDLLGSGTISGTEPGSQGSLMEPTKFGRVPLDIGNGETRSFLEDGDTVIIRGWCGSEGEIVGFGECTGQILAPRMAV